MTTQLGFTVHDDMDDESVKSVQVGRFSRAWDDEEELDQLLDSLESGRVTNKQALLQARKLLATYPGSLEIRNFLGNRLWDQEMRDEAAEMWEKAYQEGLAVIPKGFKGQIRWTEIDNRSFLRVAKGHLLGLMHRGDGKVAMAMAKKLLAWCPADNLGVRMLLGDISLLKGDRKSALKSFLNEAVYSPAHWYQAGQIAFRDGDFVSACTYIRRGISANSYIAEGLTGRAILNEHLYWHSNNRHGTEWASGYMNAPTCVWAPEEIDFVDWVFNSAAVLRERANLMDLHEGLTYESDPERRDPYALRSAYFVNEIDDDLSRTMVRKIRNRFGLEIWPWDRAGFLRRAVGNH